MSVLSSPALPMLLEEVTVTAVERLSPTFVRIELGSPALAELGVDGPIYDQRIKLIFPAADGSLPSCRDADDAWLPTWFARPAEERGHMRTYSLRAVRGDGADTRMVIDFALHGTDGHGAAGPGSRWAAAAVVGDRLVTLAPRRGQFYGGIEFAPGAASRLLLVGDETAVPAVARILADLPPGARGAAFLEVPTRADIQSVEHPIGVELTWLPREGAAYGELVHAAALTHLGTALRPLEVSDDEIDPDLWETPGYSSSGEDIDDTVRVVGHDLDGLYAWIAGESKTVTGLRRALVKDLGVDRRQVAFMGYWRQGVAMKS